MLSIYWYWFIPCRASMTVLIFIARAFIAGGFQAAYVYTPEVRYLHSEQFCSYCVKHICRAELENWQPPMYFWNSAGIPNSDQSFRIGNKQWNGQGWCPNNSVCCPGNTLFSHDNTAQKCQSVSVTHCDCPWASSCRWCWSPLCTWLCQCTAAVASSRPSPPARCQLRRQAAACRSPATVSGDRRWWVGPLPTALEESLTPAPAPRAEDASAAVQLRGDHSEEEKQREGRQQNQLSVFIFAPLQWSSV